MAVRRALSFVRSAFVSARRASYSAFVGVAPAAAEAIAAAALVTAAVCVAARAAAAAGFLYAMASPLRGQVDFDDRGRLVDLQARVHLGPEADHVPGEVRRP